MELYHPKSNIHVPDLLELPEALGRTTHQGIGAHQDDLELMALDGILQCYQKPDKWFGGITCTNGGGCPKIGKYKDCTDEEIQEIRYFEQLDAAEVGKYGSLAQLGYDSSDIKNRDPNVVDDLVAILKESRPEFIYTHNLADKHDTHVAVAKRVITALRELEGEYVPCKVYGCEVWRGLDWLPDDEKVVFNVSEHEQLKRDLLMCFDSQLEVCNYLEGAIGRQKANATFLETHREDLMEHTIYAMDLTPLVHDPGMDMDKFVDRKMNRFCEDVKKRIKKL